MNTAQRVILFLGLVAIIGLSLRPPFQWEHGTYLLNRESGVPHKVASHAENIGHRWIWDVPEGWGHTVSFRERRSRAASVDWPRLGVYVGAATLITLFAAFVVFGNRKAVK